MASNPFLCKALKALLKSALGLLAVFTLLVRPAFAQADALLVTPQWVKENQSRKDVVLIDASPAPFYIAKHIPGATSVSFPQEHVRSQGANLSYGGGIDYLTDPQAAFPFQDQPTAKVQELFRDWGINNNSLVVLYDEGGSQYATRLFFSLVYHGFPASQVRLLNGGLAQWEAQQLPVTQDVAKVAKRGNFKSAGVKPEIKTDLPEVLSVAGDSKAALVEALNPSWHFGEVLNYSRRGHIPYAIMVPAADFYKADKTFKSPDEIRRMLKHFGITSEQTVYTHCGGGIAGSVAFFAIKYLAQYPKVKHFPESQLGWLEDKRELAFWTYDAPYLLRDANWLQWWGGQRTRTLGNVHVSVVDVRTPEQFAEGHVPFALNVPAQDIRKQLKQPQALAKQLGDAGVNPAHEAVVISGNGLSKESALAYVALEALGQKKVSILSDSLDDWAANGFQLRDKPTIVGAKQIPFDLSVPVVPYNAKARDDVLVNDPEYSKGLYPKIYLASGAAVPGKALDGKVVQVPYTELLNKDGRPKSAADIWKVLSKAGVDRLAEVVTVSDDPGEAAVNYVILKLMGYPNVKTLAL